MKVDNDQLAQDLRDCYERLKEAVADLRPLIRHLPPMERERAKAYWLPSLETALDDEHDYLGGSPCTLLEVVEKLEGDSDGEDEEEEDDQ